MIISGNNFRSLAERDSLSFRADISLKDRGVLGDEKYSGVAEFGFSGDSEGIKFIFSGGRMIDPEGRYFHSYKTNETFSLSGNLATGTYEYYVNDNISCSVGKKNKFEINKFFTNTDNCSLSIDLFVNSTAQDYSLEYSDSYTEANIVSGEIKNNSTGRDFVVFTGEVTEGGQYFEVDYDIPTGTHSGNYIQDYKYFVGSGDLDEFNGRLAVTPEFPSGIYHYHITEDWPYVLPYYKGVPVEQVTGITETVSGTAPSGVPYPWRTGKFSDTQTRVVVPPLSGDIHRSPRSGVGVKFSDDNIYVTSEGIPDHYYGPFPNSGNPNEVFVQKHLFKIPLTPTNETDFKPLPHGNVGVAINGVPFDLMSNEYYKSKKNWNHAALPGELGLDDHNAHVQPNGKYHYHARPSGIACDNDFSTPTIAVANTPEKYKAFSGEGLTKHVDVFGLNVFATSGTPDAKVLHAANVMAQYIDNDNDGRPDNLSVANTLVCNDTSIIMTSGGDEFTGIDMNKLYTSGYFCLEHLRADQTNVSGQFDASLEEVLRLLARHGWCDTYESALGLFSGTTIANYMDSGRGGHFEFCKLYNKQTSHEDNHRHTYTGVGLDGNGWTNWWYDPSASSKKHRHRISNWSVQAEASTSGASPHGHLITNKNHEDKALHCSTWGAVNSEGTYANGKADNRYPSGSWYHDDDEACDYSCQIAKYIYWGVTTILGAQTGRCDAISSEWEFCTATGLASGDPNLYNILTDSQYLFPTGNLPDGNYSPSETVNIEGSTGHSPIMGYAFDGYPIYGPRGYVNTNGSGGIKEMKTSYLPKGTARKPAYPKTIKDNDDLYLPYRVDLLNTAPAPDNTPIAVNFYTSFGTIKKEINPARETGNAQEGATSSPGGSNY